MTLRGGFQKSPLPPTDRIPNGSPGAVPLRRWLLRRLHFRRGFENGHVPERRVAIAPETMQRVGRDDHDVPGFRDDFNTVDRVDTSPFVHDEDLTLRMTVLVRTYARRIGAQPDDHGQAALVKANEPNRCALDPLERLHVRCLDERL